jgi:small nuclear ribonucleoprotein (snRNP)-like protein
MAKKQKSFADKAAGSASGDSVYVKYVKSVQSEETGRWRFNEQIVRMNKGEQLDAALKRMDEAANLVDIDLSEFVSSAENKADTLPKEEPNDSGSDGIIGSNEGQVNDIENVRSDDSDSSEEE